MGFDDFDTQKSELNKKTRSIDFIEARAIWDDENSVDVPAKNVDGEVRFGTVE